ncbi:MAG: ABC-F family ATP-binding cassette domain-containing protein [Candidatus Krumholzibacteriia bacterium]
MPLVALDSVTFDYGRERILYRVGVAVEPGVKYALVGPNGAGKTTLLAALAGELEVEGRRDAATSLRIGFLRQAAALGEAAEGATVREAVAQVAFAAELALERDLEQIAAVLPAAAPAELARLVERQGKLQAEFERLDGYTMHARLEAALAGVGLPPATWSRRPGQLSGGERRRAALAAVLLRRSDLLLLDEPTNHLDLAACEWLEDHLDQNPGAAVLVSHDRHFLDRLCTRTWHLDRGRLQQYSGNYSFFDEQRQLRYQQELAAWENQQARIRQAEDYIARNIAGQKTRQAQSRRKQLEKLERVERPPAEPGLYRFRIEPMRASGATVLQADSISRAFAATPLFRDLDLLVVKGDRVGIIGPNGCGKTTLLRVLAGIDLPDTGRVIRGHNVDLGYYDQELASVSDLRTPLEELAAVDPVAPITELRGLLGAFGFEADAHERLVRDLSGGQRSRLALLKLVKQGYNTLLLDEPTNHLDVRSRESLEGALRSFDGTLVVISHDRRFLDKLVDRLLVFPGPDDLQPAGEVVQHLGNYQDWVRRRRAEAAAAAAATAAERRGGAAPAGAAAGGRAAAPTGASGGGTGGGTGGSAGGVPAAPDRRPLSKNEQARRRSLIADLEERVARLEDEHATALVVLSDPDTPSERRLALGRRCEELDAELSAALAQWEQLHREIEEGVEGGA